MARFCQNVAQVSICSIASSLTTLDLIHMYMYLSKASNFIYSKNIKSDKLTVELEKFTG